ncbi:MAG: sugar transferase [Sandaracinaceae bacterium]|nr:sugar transferase [Sandaracinaceae bacterium]
MPAEKDPGLPRAVEAMLALTGLVIVGPVLALAGLAIALESPGPILFRQVRVGQNGKPFTLYKLRSMRMDTGKGLGVTAADDDRTTHVGRFLRKTKLDEFPELWNVVAGQMSLVGPRPEVPRYVNLTDPLWQKALAVRPGLTDPVYLGFRDEEAFMSQVDDDRENYYLTTLQKYKLRGHIEYLERRSWVSDVAILFKTVHAILAPSKAPLPDAAEVERIARGESSPLNTPRK